MKEFEVIILEYQTGHKETHRCDLIDHDTTGDIRLYKYTNPDKPINPLRYLKLVTKFESHTHSILTVDYIE